MRSCPSHRNATIPLSRSDTVAAVGNKNPLMRSDATLSRRSFLKSAAGFATAAAGVGADDKTAPLQTRGVVLMPSDLSLKDWPERAKAAGINTIGLHWTRKLNALCDFVAGDDGAHFLARCKELGIAVEYELHAMGDLLPRELFQKDPALFRMDDKGQRTADTNCCPHSPAALDLIAEKAAGYARRLPPTTHRYFFWPDDGGQWCRCPKCTDLAASDQALLVENHILRALRRHDARATLSHISYAHTLLAPQQVKPESGVFLEFAPIDRDYTKPITDRDAKIQSRPRYAHPETNAGYLDVLEANMKLFGVEHTQVLEYWLDVSRFSRWKRPAVKLPWNAEICRADIAAYRALGVPHITTFAVYMDADYVKLHGDPQPVLLEYGAALNPS